MGGSFESKVVIVTGAAGGMGRATAVAFGAAGAAVVVADVAAGAEETAELVRAAGGRAEAALVDVADAALVDAMVAVATGTFGGLDAAVNAAAIEIEETALAECEEATFDRVIAVNLKGIFLTMRAEVRAMLALGRGGAIVNIGSTNSFRPQEHQCAYTASKHGVLGITRNAAIEYARHGIRINAISPGPIDTPMLRGAMARRGRDPLDVQQRLSLLGRFGEPEEIAKAALWLCSDDSSFTIGHALAVDGGYLAR